MPQSIRPVLSALVAAGLLGLSVQGALAQTIQSVDGIAAVAGNRAITVRELTLTMQAMHKKGQDSAAVRQEALNTLITKALLVQLGTRSHVTASEAEIDAQVAKIAAGAKISTEALYKQMQQQGVTRKQFRQSVADNIIVDKVMEQNKMSAAARVSDAEVAQAVQSGQYHLPAGTTAAPSAYQVEHILIKPDGKGDKAALEKARQIWQRARSGENFEALARQYSADSSAASGGMIGWVSAGMTVPEFENTFKKLKPGQISAPVKSTFGWHIIKLIDVKQDTSPEAALNAYVRQQLAEQKAAQSYNAILQDLRRTAYVEIRQR